MPDALLHDLRHALRHLQRSPGFSATAILTLALGIGANTAMFTVLNALLLRPLPIPDPHGLIAVSSVNNLNQRRLTLIPAVTELRKDGPLDTVCGINGGGVFAAEVNGAPTQSVLALVTGGCFDVFGVPPLLGRTITDADAPIGPRGAFVAVIGHRFWTRMFAADPAVIGRTIRSEGFELTVIGVMPEGFDGIHIDTSIDVYAPFNTISPARADRAPGASHLIGRLKPGLDFTQAAAELATRWPALQRAVVPGTLGDAERSDLINVRAHVERMGTGLSFLRDRYVGPVTIIAGLTAVLLLLAGLNLGGLLLSRLAARGSELGIRLALGGSRRRIARQMLLENLLVSICGAALAFPASLAIVQVLIAFLPGVLTDRALTFEPDWRVLTMIAACAAAAAILMSAVPIALAWRRRGPVAFGWDRTIAGATNHWARALLVVQVALSVIMLSGAGLLVRSLYLLQHKSLGMRTDGVLTVRVMPQPNAYRTIDNASYYPALLDRVASLPGVRSAGFARILPRLTVDFGGMPISLVGEPAGHVRATLESASPGLFETIGVPILRGRGPAWSDNARSVQVAMVSESLASQLLPGGDVVGRRVRFGTNRLDQDVVVVGVIANASLGNPRRADLPVFYRPMLQAGPFANFPSLLVAADGEPLALQDAIANAIREGGREYAHSIETVRDVFARAPSAERMSATLAGAIGVLAVLLAFIGVHALVAYSVSRRTREIGVRVALGASRADVLRMVIEEGLVLTALGTAIGIPAAIAAGRVLGTLLFGLTASDPPILATTALFFVLLGLAAGLVPALRAAAVDPTTALRSE